MLVVRSLQDINEYYLRTKKIDEDEDRHWSVSKLRRAEPWMPRSKEHYVRSSMPGNHDSQAFPILYDGDTEHKFNAHA